MSRQELEAIVWQAFGGLKTQRGTTPMVDRVAGILAAADAYAAAARADLLAAISREGAA